MTQPDGAIRTFIALETPPWVRQVLAQTIGQLQAAIPCGIRWVAPTGIHLTLKFLGDVDPRQVDDLLKAMTNSARGSVPFHLRLAGLGVFPNHRQPRVLWVGLAGDLQPLQQLQGKVEEEVRKLAPMSRGRESRPFHPHLTLGRVREGVSQAIRSQIGAALVTTTWAPCDPWRVVAVHLICSTLSAQGAVYTSLGVVPLSKLAKVLDNSLPP